MVVQIFINNQILSADKMAIRIKKFLDWCKNGRVGSAIHELKMINSDSWKTKKVDDKIEYEDHLGRKIERYRIQTERYTNNLQSIILNLDRIHKYERTSSFDRQSVEKRYQLEVIYNGEVLAKFNEDNVKEFYDRIETWFALKDQGCKCYQKSREYYRRNKECQDTDRDF